VSTSIVRGHYLPQNQTNSTDGFTTRLQCCWRLDSFGDFLLAPSGNRIRLAINEARLLKVLLDKPGEVALARDLAAGLGLLPEEYDKHRVEVIISRLRDKVLRETGHPLPVLTRRGIGYMFLPETP
jgi:DNA-binding response OmpR family regulator